MWGAEIVIESATQRQHHSFRNTTMKITQQRREDKIEMMTKQRKNARFGILLFYQSPLFFGLHPEHAPCALLVDALVLPTTCHLQSHAEYPPGVLRWYDSIVPQPGRPKRCFTFVFDSCLERRIHLLANSLHDRRKLFCAHDRCLGIRPGKHEPGRVCSTARSSTLVNRSQKSKPGDTYHMP